MKFISLTCPYCGGHINLEKDHKFGECLYCNHKIMLVNDELKLDERSDPTYSEFESIRYFIESGSIQEGLNFFAKKYRNEPNNAHGWLLCGYLQLMGSKPFEDENTLMKNLQSIVRYAKEPEESEYDKRMQTAFSSWKRAFSCLDNQYYLTDYCKIIGLALTSEGVESRNKHIIPPLEDMKESIESHFNISFSADFYYFILKGYLRRKRTDKFYDRDELAFKLMTRVILYERDVDALAIKSQMLNCNGILDEYYIKKEECIFFVLSLIYGQMSKKLMDEDKAKIRNSWTEVNLYSQNSTKWKSLMSNDYSTFNKDDLKLLSDHIDQCISFDRDKETMSAEEEDKETMSAEEEEAYLKKFEHIEEEIEFFKQIFTRKRRFTQYIVINGTFYERYIELSRKEFDGDIAKKSDLEKLKTLFEKEYEDIVVGADGYYEKYTLDEVRDYFDEEDIDDFEEEKNEFEEEKNEFDVDDISEPLLDFFEECINFTNILESKRG